MDSAIALKNGCKPFTSCLLIAKKMFHDDDESEEMTVVLPK